MFPEKSFYLTFPKLIRKMALNPSDSLIFKITSFMDNQSDVSKQEDFANLFYWYNNQSKGVSILFYQLPYSLKPVKLYPITSNSKAAWGLLVYLEIGSIFTAIPVSLSQSLRQLLHREIIHARHHLNAKVFRYLRTLIGKAAIKWGFLRNLAYKTK